MKVGLSFNSDFAAEMFHGFSKKNYLSNKIRVCSDHSRNVLLLTDQPGKYSSKTFTKR
jgi:hypothetical protein